MSTRWERFYDVIAQIPEGRVATYGEVARLAGFPRAAREVGWCLRAVPEGRELPWWRVVNARGAISPRAGGALDQAELLRAEGIPVTDDHTLPLAEYAWFPTESGHAP